jgi:hypothetical protein
MFDLQGLSADWVRTMTTIHSAKTTVANEKIRAQDAAAKSANARR